MSDQQPKSILAIALESTQRAQALAVWHAEHLTILELRELVGTPTKWLPTMQKDIADKVRKGWVVMIEDRTGALSANATAFNFDAKGDDGRTYLQTALDWYFALDGRGAIILDTKMQRYALRMGGEGGLIYSANDEKGRLLYKIDWNRFSAGHKALLMCVLGAVQEEPLSERWLQEWLKTVPPPSEGSGLAILRALRKQYEQNRADFEARRDALEAQKYVFH